MINISIFGSTGYAGGELVRLLSKHPHVNIKHVTSNSHNGERYGDIFESFRHWDFTCSDITLEQAAEDSDAVFLAMPHGAASKIVTEKILSKTKTIDLGADYRLKDVSTYETWYKQKHESRDLIKEAVYGLCEVNREMVKGSRLIANPGCYTTCSILPLYPLLKEKAISAEGIVIDAKSGVSGAGRVLSLSSHYDEANESIKAYKVASHQHTPEIEEQLSYAHGSGISLVFTPHLTPMNRGILCTIYAKPSKQLSYDDVKEIYNKYYGNEFFIRFTKQGAFPETKWVKGSNFCDIGFQLDKRTNTLILVSAIDNMVKGAAGQAIQNMNILFGFDEKTAIDDFPVFPA